MIYNRFAVVVSLFLVVGSAYAAPSPQVKMEVEQLFKRLEQSNCQFNRNGSWYSAQEASTHLRKKYQYLLKKDRIATVDDFIRLAATESSMSGQVYQVQCAGKPSVPSAVWFKTAP